MAFSTASKAALVVGGLALGTVALGVALHVYSVTSATLPVTCVADPAKCTDAAYFPMCADPIKSFCHTIYNECMYPIKKANACPCVERDVRVCNFLGTNQGIRTCVKTAAGTGTQWGPCQDI